MVRADGFIGSANNLVSPAYMCRDKLTLKLLAELHSQRASFGHLVHRHLLMHVRNVVIATGQRLPMQAMRADCLGRKIHRNALDRSCNP